jgi:hypothetical protein
MNYLRMEYVNLDQKVFMKIQENLITVLEMRDAFNRFLLACGFTQEGIDDDILDQANEIERQVKHAGTS